jgi:uncharacterized lipoprotein NlpE involved in copper resistance
MKLQNNLLTLCTVAALTFLVGCDNKPANQGDAKANDTTKAAEGAATGVSKAIESAKPAVEKAVTDAQATATTAATDASAKANSIIDQAKALIGQNKYSDALNSLSSLSNLKLTAEQEKIVADLKAQIQKAMSSDGAKAVGNLLKQ